MAVPNLTVKIDPNHKKIDVTIAKANELLNLLAQVKQLVQEISEMI